MAKKDKIPSILYVPLEHNGDDGLFCAGANLICIADMGEKKQVGIYKLSEIVEVEGKAVIVR